MIAVFLVKSKSFIIAFKDSVSEFTDCHLFNRLGIFRIYFITYRKTEKKKTKMIFWRLKISIKYGMISNL